MNKEEKKEKIEELKKYIDELEFKAKAFGLKAKYANKTEDILTIAWNTVYLASQIRITYYQIQRILAIPTHKKGGLAICGSKKSEIILKPDQ